MSQFQGASKHLRKASKPDGADQDEDDIYGSIPIPGIEFLKDTFPEEAEDGFIPVSVDTTSMESKKTSETSSSGSFPEMSLPNFPKKNIKLSGGSNSRSDEKSSDEYERYIWSSDFLSIHPLLAVQTCSLLSKKSADPLVRDFWKEYAPQMDVWFGEEQVDVLTIIHQTIRDGTTCLDKLLSGIIIGQSLEASEPLQQYQIKISKLIETMRQIETDAQQNFAAHQKQIDSFTFQINAATETINQALKNVEHFEMWKARVGIYKSAHPPSPPVRQINSPRSQSSNVASNESTESKVSVVGRRVPRISENGTYRHPDMVIMISDGVVTSVSIGKAGLQPLHHLVGKQKIVAEYILNRYIKGLESYGDEHPAWLDCLEDTFSDAARRPVIEKIKDFPVIEYQWELVDP